MTFRRTVHHGAKSAQSGKGIYFAIFQHLVLGKLLIRKAANPSSFFETNMVLRLALRC